MDEPRKPKVKPKAKPRVKEVEVSIRLGGKIQIVQFQYSADYSYLVGYKYDVDMTEEEADKFWKEQHAKLSEQMGPVEQQKVDELQDLRDKLSKRGSAEDDND